MRRYTPLTLAVPAQTPASAPVSKTWALYPAYVRRITFDIPAGHNRLTGVRLVWHGTPVIPFDATTWVVGNGQPVHVDLETEVDGLGLVVQGFNTDQYAHTFYCYADVDPHHRAHLEGIRSHRLGDGTRHGALERIAALASPGAGGAP